jgi:hypothetical protein
MAHLTIATNLTDDSTNVDVTSVDELLKFAKFAGGIYNLYIWVKGFGEWTTLGSFTDSNNIEILF